MPCLQIFLRKDKFMTLEEYAIVEALLGEYRRVCRSAVVHPEAHREYVNAHNYLHPEEPIEFRPRPDPFKMAWK